MSKSYVAVLLEKEVADFLKDLKKEKEMRSISAAIRFLISVYENYEKNRG